MEQSGLIRQVATEVSNSANEVHLAMALRRMSELQMMQARQSPKDLLGSLSDAGFAWRDIAALVGVSVAAVQKWRRGEAISGERRLSLARICALLQLAEVTFLILDPVSWLEMPIMPGVHATALDLFLGGRDDLVVRLMSENPPQPESVLDSYDPQWRVHLVDNEFETFEAADGMISIRPRNGVRIG